MVQVLKPSKVEVVTQNGECNISISIELVIDLRTDQTPRRDDDPVVVPKKKEREEALVLPDFSNTPKVQFGQKVK